METPAPQASGDTWTIQRILQWTAEYLKGRGVESARLESELMLAHARGCQRIHLYTDFESIVPEQQRTAMREMVQRRARREPLSYIIGEREFYGRSYHVGPGVLIPRPETEILVDVALEHLPADSADTVVDVGCGSGCIAVTMAMQRSGLQVLATDVSLDALSFSRINIARYDVESRVQLFEGNLLTPLPASDTPTIAGVISNPPYIRDGDMAGLAPEVAEYEPSDALVGGSDGLDVIRELVEQSAAHIRPGGFFAVEIDPPQASDVCRLLELAGFTQCRVRQDLNQQDRVVQAVRSS